MDPRAAKNHFQVSCKWINATRTRGGIIIRDSRKAARSDVGHFCRKEKEEGNGVREAKTRRVKWTKDRGARRKWYRVKPYSNGSIGTNQTGNIHEPHPEQFDSTPAFSFCCLIGSLGSWIMHHKVALEPPSRRKTFLPPVPRPRTWGSVLLNIEIY